VASNFNIHRVIIQTLHLFPYWGVFTHMLVLISQGVHTHLLFLNFFSFSFSEGAI
jgi:hypothetical protein